MSLQIKVAFWACLFFINLGLANAGQPINLTLESAVDFAISNSYRFRRLKLAIEKSILRLEAEKAGLKTQVFLNLETPNLQNISEYKWNSNLYRDEIVRQNTSRWQSDLAIKQPLILFGYPTNGYFSLNYRSYRYLQKADGERELDYYNRLYLKFEQPLFVANELKNDLEQAELNLQDVQLEYYSDLIEIMQDISEDYFEIFEKKYENVIYRQKMEQLLALRTVLVQGDTSEFNNEMGLTQVDLEISNARENILSNESETRNDITNLKLRLHLSEEDSVEINPVIDVKPIDIDLQQALHFGFTNNPRLKHLDIKKRQSEIELEDEKSENAFQLALEMTYGIEKKDERVRYLWDDFDNSNSITVNAFLPIWDGGQRKKNIQAKMLSLRQDELQIEEEKQDIEKDIINAYRSLMEYYQRLENLQRNVNLSHKLVSDSIEKMKTQNLPVENLLQMIARTQDTQSRLLDIYIDYKRAMLDLMEDTYYDFERDLSLLDSFK